MLQCLVREVAVVIVGVLPPVGDFGEIMMISPPNLTNCAPPKKRQSPPFYLLYKTQKYKAFNKLYLYMSTKSQQRGTNIKVTFKRLFVFPYHIFENHVKKI